MVASCVWCGREKEWWGDALQRTREGLVLQCSGKDERRTGGVMLCKGREKDLCCSALERTREGLVL